MKKNVGWLGLLILIISVILIGCTNGGKSNDNEKENKTLTFWVREDASDLVIEAVDKYNASSKDVFIEIKTFPSSNFSDQFATALASNDEPDIIAMDAVLAPYFSSIGAFKEITDKFEELDYKDEFNHSLMNLGQLDGKQYGTPFSTDVSALIYNKEHFREAGLDPDEPPQTWDELKEYSEKLTNDKHFGYVYSGGNAGGLMFTFMPYVWGNKGAILNEDGTQSMINSVEAEEVLDLFEELINNGVTPEGAPSYDWDQTHDAFFSERASMIVSGNFQISNLNQNYPDLDYGVSLIPKNNEGGDHSSFSGGNIIAITKSSEHVDEAWNFLQYMYSEDVQVEIFAKNGIIPVRKDLYDNQYFEDEPKYKVFAESLDVSNAAYSTQYNELYDPILDGLQRFFNGESNPKQTLEEIDSGINSIISK